jgi:hypothetical protein
MEHHQRVGAEVRAGKCDGEQLPLSGTISANAELLESGFVTVSGQLGSEENRMK